MATALTETARLLALHLARAPGQAWYLTPAALDAIRAIRADPPALVEHRQEYALTTDRWTAWEGPTFDALRALWPAHTSDDLDADPQTVTFAVLGDYPIRATRDDGELIDRIAGEIGAALAVGVAA